MGGEPFMTGLAKKTFLVTGSGKGLGGSLAIEAAKHGAQVVLHYRVMAAGRATLLSCRLSLCVLTKIQTMLPFCVAHHRVVPPIWAK